ncbi:MAG: CAP domain-containing protein [Ilumatobacter sp.]
MTSVPRLAVALTVVVASLAPAGVAFADPDNISKPAAVLRSADRVRAPQPQPVPVVRSDVQQILDLVNDVRSDHGLRPVSLSERLSAAAQGHTERMASDGAIFHTDPDDGSNPGTRISRTGYKFATWGENVAAGFPTADAVMKAWMNSPGHCKNVLNPAFTELGVGLVTGGNVYNQFWTQKFARPADEPRPSGSYNSAWC